MCAVTITSADTGQQHTAAMLEFHGTVHAYYRLPLLTRAIQEAEGLRAQNVSETSFAARGGPLRLRNRISRDGRAGGIFPFFFFPRPPRATVFFAGGETPTVPLLPPSG